MSNYFYDIPEIADIPKCTTLAFLKWCERYRRIRRTRALEMAEGESVYYFSTSGNDANSGLTDALPKKTIGAAQAILAAWGNASSGLVLKFKCGDTWQPDTVGEGKLDFSNKYNVCFTNYGDLSQGLPSFNRWKTPVSISTAETSVTRGDAHTNTYSFVKPGSESWYTVRATARKDVAFRHVGSIAEVNATPGTCWVDHAGAGRIYFNRFTTSTQLFEYYEFLTPDPTLTVAMIGNNDTTGVLATGEVAVIGIEISGCAVGTYGAESTAANTINLRGYGDATLYVLDCCLTYTSRHHIVTASGSGAPEQTGTIQFVDNCEIGWMSASGGSTLTVANSIDGGTEMFVSNCTVIGGYIPRSTVTAGGLAFISHGNEVTLLDVIYNCHATPTPGNVNSIGGFSNMSDPAGDILACRHFQVNCSVAHRSLYINDTVAFAGVNRWSSNGFNDSQFYINCFAGMTQLGSVSNSGNAISGGILNGIHINGTFSVDLGRDNSRPASDIESLVSGVGNCHASMFNCLFETQNVLAGRFAWIASQPQNGTLPDAEYVANQCVFLNRSSFPRKAVSGYHNAVYFSFRVNQCAYIGISRYYFGTPVPNTDFTTIDTDYVVAQSYGPNGGAIPESLALETTSKVIFDGVEHDLEYDANGLSRFGRNAIGPFRASALSSDGSDEIITPYSTAFNPNSIWVRTDVVSWYVPKGSGVPFEFASSTEDELPAEEFTATVTYNNQVLVNFSAAEGNLTVDEVDKIIRINPTFEQTVTWGNLCYLNLWRTGSGDDNRTLHKRVVLNMYAAGSPAA